jgi:serine/threonine protein kinase
MRVPEDVSRTRVLAPVRDLARKLEKLGHDNTEFGLNDTGLLPCLCVIKHECDQGQLTQIDFVFRLPRGFGNPRIRTLREVLMAGEGSFPLDQRFVIAKQISRAVVYFHIAKFVHKNVRPETILVFDKKPTRNEDGKRPTTTHAALVGFEKFRPDDTDSFKKFRDDLWYKDMYRHPTRQGVEPVSEPLMQHDIYSLGVCLLEIGLWAPFVHWEKDNSQTMGNAFTLWTKLRRQKLNEEAPGLIKLLEKPNLDNSEQGIEGEKVTRLDDWRKEVPTAAADLKVFFVTLATEILPGLMGQKYSEIVRNCLTCLDEGNTAFGDEKDLKDDDGIIIGTRYMDKVSLDSTRYEPYD